MDRVSTGSAEADRILGGGFPVNSINILMGGPGTGKTLFAEQLAFTQRDGNLPVLYLATLSEPLAKFVTYLQEYPFADTARIGSEILYEDLAPLLTPAPEKLGEILVGLIQQHRPRLLIVDSFKAVSEMMPDPQTWRLVLSEIAGLLSAYQVTTFWVGEYTTEMISGLPEFAVADGILEFTRQQQGTRDDRRIRVVKLRGSSFLDGYHGFRITATGPEVFPRLISPVLHVDYTPVPDRLQSGIAGLDAMIETGWLAGTSTLVAGPSGAGKTVLGLHFLRQGVMDGEPGLLVSLQENPIQLARVMQAFGWDTAELLRPRAIDVFYASPVELQIDAIVSEIFRRIEAHGARRVVIDALGDLENSARDPTRFRDLMYAMTQCLAVDSVTSMLCMETRERLDTGSPLRMTVSPMSDNILQLEMQTLEDLTRHIRIVKTRGSAHDGRRRILRIAADGISVE